MSLLGLLSVIALVLLLWGVAVGDTNVLAIENAEELIQLSNSVLSGESYSGTTVFLVADIDFTEDLSRQFKPIGNYEKHFMGLFDGQGYMIRNLNVSSSSFNYTGLFGYSSGITIRKMEQRFERRYERPYWRRITHSLLGRKQDTTC